MITWIKKNTKIISTLCFFAFLIYMFETLSSYAAWFPGSTKYFIYSSTSGLILRMGVSLILIAVSVLVFIANYEKINKGWFVIVAVMIFFEFISLLYTPLTYDVLFKTGQVYPFMAYRRISVSIKDALVFSFSQTIDYLFGLLFIFILPIVLNKKRLLIILNFLILTVFYSILYSLFKERSYYIYFLKGEWVYKSLSIGSIFGNKQQWGIFLVSAFCASMYSIYIFVCSIKPKKRFLIPLIAFYVVFSLLCFFCSVVAFCKTAILSFLIFGLFAAGFGAYRLIKKKKTRIFGIIFSCLVLVLIIFVFLSRSVESLRTNTIGKLINNVFDTLESTSDNSIAVRFALVYSLLEKFPTVNLMFGMPKGVLDAYVRVTSPELIVGLHTGIVIYFGRTGIFGLVIYGILLVKLFRAYFACRLFNETLTFLYILIFAISVIMNLSESEILIFSSSMNGLILNLILVTDAMKNREEIRNEKSNQFFVCYC